MRLHHPYFILVLLFALVVLGGCNNLDILSDLVDSPSPRAEYAQRLQRADLHETALGRAWIEAGERALATELAIEPPFREAGHFAPDTPSAVGYRIAAQQGERLRIHVEAPTANDTLRLFVDLFEVAREDAADPQPVAGTTAGGDTLTVEASGRHTYLLRLQPELLHGGPYRLLIETEPTLDFPVAGHDSRHIRSFFGDARDGGARSHHGVDIFAPRGTPVLAAGSGFFTRTGNGGRGGKTVWVRSLGRGPSHYYAHLDSQLVSAPARVQAGDTLGLVGNSGNARYTPPHLHFGLYQGGPVDPLPFIRRPRPTAPAVMADTTRHGQWVRTTGTANLRSGPTTDAAMLDTAPPQTVLRVTGSSAAWHRVALPDGRSAFIAARLTQPATQALRQEQRSTGTPVRYRPTPSPTIDTLTAGASAAVLGRFEDHLLVRTPSGRTGWITGD